MAGPVKFRAVRTLRATTACGLRLQGLWDSDRQRTALRGRGCSAPRRPGIWRGRPGRRDAPSPSAWRKLAYQVARMPQGEPLRLPPDGPLVSLKRPDNARAYLPKANEYVIGPLAVHDTNQHHRWNRIDGPRYGDRDTTACARASPGLGGGHLPPLRPRQHAPAGPRRRLRVPGHQCVPGQGWSVTRPGAWHAGSPRGHGGQWPRRQACVQASHLVFKIDCQWWVRR